MKYLKLFESYINESIDVYHGSTTRFKTFNLSKIGSGDGKSLGGWGIYFSDKKSVADGYFATGGFVKKYKIEDGPYFDFEDIFYDYDSVIEKLKKKRVKASEIRELETDYQAYPDTTNKDIYEWLSHVLGSKKKASLFLSDLGYIGTKFSDRWDSDAINYVIFHPKDIIREVPMGDEYYESEYESVSDNDFIYHGTSKGAALNIQRDGYMKPNNTGEEKPSISFTNDLRYAEYYAKSKGGNDKMVILRTVLNNDFKLSPKIRNNKGVEYITFEKIQSVNLEIKTPSGWKPLNEWNVIFDEPLNIEKFWTTENINVGGYEITDKRFNQLYDESYGCSEEELREYLDILDKYQKEGGTIQRIIFSYKEPKRRKTDHSWTHINNNWEDFVQSLIDFNYDEGKLNGDESVYLMIGETPPNNILIEASLEQFETNYDEQELTIENPLKIKIISVEKIQKLNI
jgi:hypothetical protein